MDELHTVNAKYTFTEEEKREIALELAQKQVQMEKVQDDKKAMASQFKSTEDGLFAEISAAAKKINNGFEFRFFKCKRELDFERKVRVYIYPMTGEVMRTEPLRDEDYQEKMKLDTLAEIERKATKMAEPVDTDEAAK